MNDQPETCPATRTVPTAEGETVVRCTKPVGHVDQGDRQHTGRSGTWPVRWTDEV